MMIASEDGHVLSLASDRLGDTYECSCGLATWQRGRTTHFRPGRLGVQGGWEQRVEDDPGIDHVIASWRIHVHPPAPRVWVEKEEEAVA